MGVCRFCNKVVKDHANALKLHYYYCPKYRALRIIYRPGKHSQKHKEEPSPRADETEQPSASGLLDDAMTMENLLERKADIDGSDKFEPDSPNRSEMSDIGTGPFDYAAPHTRALKFRRHHPEVVLQTSRPATAAAADSSDGISSALSSRRPLRSRPRHDGGKTALYQASPPSPGYTIGVGSRLSGARGKPVGQRPAPSTGSRAGSTMTVADDDDK